MTLWNRIRAWFTPPRPLEQEMLHYQTPADAAQQYRLHLRVEKDGQGLLIINAATVLHLNQTATEYARLLLKGADEEEAVRAITARYRIGPTEARADYRRLRDQVVTLASTTDISPDVYLEAERAEPFSAETSAPYRVDAALTYRQDPTGALDPNAVKRVDRELTTDEWQQVLDRLWDAGVPHIVFTGGEPTLRDDLVTLVGYAEGLGMVTGILTDGCRLSDYSYLDSLLQAGLDHLQISLFSHEPDVHDQLVGQHGSCNQSLAGLRNALAADIYVVVHLLVVPENATQVKDSIDFLADMGVKAVALSSPLRAATEESRQQLHAAMEAARTEAHARALTVIWDLAAPYSHANPVELEAEVQPAQVLRQYLYIEPDGDVLPAQGLNVVLGNILRDDWKSIWENPKRP